MTVGAPRCKLCGVAHWSNEAHIWGGPFHPAKIKWFTLKKDPPAKKSGQRTATKKPTVPPKRADEIEKALARLAELRGKERDKKRRYRAKQTPS